MKTITILCILMVSISFASSPSDSISTSDAAYFAFIFYQGAQFNAENFENFLSMRMQDMNPAQKEAFDKFTIALTQTLFVEASKIITEFRNPDTLNYKFNPSTLHGKKLEYLNQSPAPIWQIDSTSRKKWTELRRD
jgi:hypothetical protein